MKRSLAILAGILALMALAIMVVYFLTEPDLHKTKKRTADFHSAAVKGIALGEAIQASPHFSSVIFGPCGHLDPSPDSGPKGSLIFSPAEGAFARYSNFQEFLRLNPKLLSKHEACRKISVQYMTIFPYTGAVDIEVDERGNILAIQDPVFWR